MEKTGIQQAVAKAGGQAELGALLGVTQQSVSGWVAQGYAPYGRARQIYHHTDVDPRKLVDPVIRDLFDYRG